MKNYTSRFLKTIALAHMAFPALYILSAALLFDIPARLCVRILLSPSYYILSALVAVAGYGLWEMKRWGWYVFGLANLFIVYANAVMVSSYGETNHKVMAFVLATLTQILIVIRVSREVRVPYFLPKIRWWESNPRYKLSVPVRIRRENGLEFSADILDLSMSGCFVKYKSDLEADENLSLEFEIFGLKVECGGVVVWRTSSTVTHPKGVGVKFTVLQRPQRRVLKAITLRLKKIAALYRSHRYLSNQDEFIRRLEKLKGENLNVSGDDSSERTQG